MPRWHLKLFILFLVIVTSSAKNTPKPEISSKSSSLSESDSASQNSTCFLPNCRKCDILDLESCTCTPVFVKCAKGFIFDEETCNCIESSSEPSLCPSLTCPKGQHVNEARCECTNKICQTFAPCPSNTILDLETCECICNLDPNICPDYYIFDEFNCLCRHPVCDPPGPCPGSSVWDTELCQCKCTQQICKEDLIFDVSACDCVSIYSTEPSTVYPTESNTYCNPPSSCPGLSSWNKETCTCVCAVKVKCIADYIFDNDTCHCENPLGSSSQERLSSKSKTESDSSTEVSTDSSSSCYLPDCRSCDFFSPEDCFCYKIAIDCIPGYWLDDEGCKCIPIPGYSTHPIFPSIELSFSPSIFSQSSISSCSIPDCRPCDYLDLESCECYRVVVDCMFGYRNTEDGCSCEPIPGFSYPSETSCDIQDCGSCGYLDQWSCQCIKYDISCEYGYRESDTGCYCEPIPGFSFSSEISPSPSCEPSSSCPDKSILNTDTCKCQCIENILCIQNYTFNSETCKCEPMFEGTTEPSTYSQSVFSSCSNPDCRWCDYMDVINCECYRIAIDCIIGYELSSDGCSCIPISGFSYSSFEELSSESNSGPIPTFPCTPISSCPDKHFWSQESCSCECVEQVDCNTNFELSLRTCKCEPVKSTEPSNSFESSSISELSTSPCFIPSCRWCDYLDYENCICRRTEFECLDGYQKSKDGCSCFFISNGNLTRPPAIESSSPCFIESCRWCDKINIENCTCQRAYVDCALGFDLSSDGCSCVKSSSPSESSSSSSTNLSSSSSNLTSFSPFLNSSASCSLPYCRSCDILDTESCVCHRIVVDCSEGFNLSEDGCNCEWIGLPSTPESSSEPVSPTFGACGFNSPPYCRWCDYYDTENCICHMRYVDCYWGYELSPDGCTCIESNATSENCIGVYCDKGTFIDKNTCQCIPNPSSSSSISSPSSSSSTLSSSSTSDFSNTSFPPTCSLPYCRPCDVLDTENCICHKRVVDCFQGYELSEDGCECVKSHSTSENCPGIYCKKGTYIDPNSCQCMNDKCKFADSCPGNLLMDTQTCECFCNLNPSDCPFPYKFDHANCKCRHPPCDPPGPCPNNLSWDPENCKCRCIQNKACDPNFIFDSDSCDCVCNPKVMNTTCPSGSVFDSLLCDCIEEIDCYDFDDPACACECEEVFDCPPGKEFDLDYCDCLCPYFEVDPCQDGSFMSDETCECVKQHPRK